MSTQELEPAAPRIEIAGPDGLTLKELIIEDAQAYFDALHNNPERFRHGEEKTLERYSTVQDVVESIEDPDPEKVRFGIWDNGVMVGYVKLSFNRPKSAELGYWSGYGGQDYTERASRLLMEYAFRNYGLDKITAWAATDNEGSITVLNRLGFKRLTDGRDQIFFELGKPSEAE